MCAWWHLCSVEYINVCVTFGWHDESYEYRMFHEILHKELYLISTVICQLVCLCVSACVHVSLWVWVGQYINIICEWIYGLINVDMIILWYGITVVFSFRFKGCFTVVLILGFTPVGLYIHITDDYFISTFCVSEKIDSVIEVHIVCRIMG